MIFTKRRVSKMNGVHIIKRKTGNGTSINFPNGSINPIVATKLKNHPNTADILISEIIRGFICFKGGDTVSPGSSSNAHL